MIVCLHAALLEPAKAGSAEGTDIPGSFRGTGDKYTGLALIFATSNVSLLGVVHKLVAARYLGRS